MMPEAAQTGTKSKNTCLLEQRMEHEQAEKSRDDDEKETSFILPQQQQQQQDQQSTQTSSRSTTRGASTTTTKHRHHSHEQPNHHHHHHHHHREQRKAGVDRHHGHFGRCPPSSGEISKHHQNRKSSDLSPQEEVIRIGNKQILHADVECSPGLEPDLSSYQREVTIGNRRRIIIRRSATLQHQTSISSSADLNRSTTFKRPPGSGSLDEPGVRSVSGGRRLLTQDPALSHLVNGDRCETTTTFVSDVDVRRPRPRSELLAATPSASSSVIRFDRSCAGSYNSSTDPLMIHVATDPTVSLVCPAGGPTTTTTTATTPTVMSGPCSTWRRRWWRWRLSLSSCCRSTKRVCAKRLHLLPPPQGFQNDELSRRQSVSHRDGDVELVVPRLQPHCSFGPAEILFASFRTEGRVTTACLWHACRAVTIGGILVILGITMAILGFVNEQRAVQHLIANGSLPAGNVPGPGQPRQEGFHLNNLSFAGPVVMGVGGFLIVAACIMIFESRDSAAKIVPVSATMHGPGTENNTQGGPIKVADSTNFCSSSSQTTFLDRNIVQNLSVAAAIGIADSSSKLSSIGVGCMAAPGSISVANFGSSATMTTLTAGCGVGGPPSYRTAKRVRPKAAVPASYTSGSGSANKSASFSHLPEVDSSLPLMDEIGRRALTDAFIHFAKETGRRRRFLYNPAMDAFASPEFRSSCYEDESYPEDSVRHAIPKCPSAPNIHHHKLYHSSTLPAMTVTLASVSASASSCQSQQVQSQCPRSTKSGVNNRSNVKLSLSPLPPTSAAANAAAQSSVAHNNSSQSLIPSSSSTTSHGTYRVLTPTMYRSRMACARQAVSMDYEDGDRAKFRREGPSIRRDPSPFSRGRPGTFKSRNARSGDNSLELELGASATRVHQIGTVHVRKACVSPTTGDESFSHHTGSSLALDLHVEGGASITLLVRDESRSSRSMTSTAQNVTNSITDSSSQSRDARCDEYVTKPIPKDETIFEDENNGSKHLSETETDDKEDRKILQNGKNWSSLTEEDSLSLATEKPDDVVLIIEEDSGKPPGFTGGDHYNSSSNQEDLEDEDSRTLADKIASFEYIDDTDVEDEDDLAWSPFEENEEDVDVNNVVTKTSPKRRLQTASNSSSPIQSELDVWSPTSHRSETEEIRGRKETAELERHLLFAVAKQLPARRASAESLSQDSRLGVTPESRMSSSKSFTLEMEKKILQGCDAPKTSHRKDSRKFDLSDATRVSQRRDSNSQRDDKVSHISADTRVRKNSRKQMSCDANVTPKCDDKKCDEDRSPELCSEPVGVLRRCSTKRHALVRQSKVIGDQKQRSRIEEKLCQEKPE